MIRPVLLIALAACLPSAELVVRDLRVGAATRPLDFDFDYSGDSTSRSGSDSFDASFGIEGGGRWSFARAGDAVGLVLGTDLLIDGWSYDGTDGLATTSLRGSAGAGWAVTDRVALTVEGGLQGGLSRMSLPSTDAAPGFSAKGFAYAYDLRLEAIWLATRRFGIAADAGWLISKHSLSGDADVTITQSGWFLGVTAVWRFTDAPPLLE